MVLPQNITLISHRGNLNGENPTEENKPEYVKKALKEGYECEIDVWFVNKKYYLGHDFPSYETNLVFLSRPKLWCHAKNRQALEKLLENHVHCFWHVNEDFVFTSRGYLWHHVENTEPINSDRTILMLDKSINICHSIYGVCSDSIKILK